MNHLLHRLLMVLIAFHTLSSNLGRAAETFVIPKSTAARHVAITFDDLPAARISFTPEILNDPKKFRTANEKLLRRLRKLRVPVAGFVTSGFAPRSWTTDDMHLLLQSWSDSGAILGNHSAFHWDFQEAPADEFFSSVRRGQQFLKEAIGSAAASKRYFRAPYLHRGKTAADREQFQDYMETHDYQLAPVTIDLQDWIFAEIYAWADANGDEATKRTTVAAYLPYLRESIEHYALLSTSVAGREVPHIALLHANALNYDNIGAVVDQFRRLEFNFVDMESALQDRAYDEPPVTSGSVVRSWQFKQHLPWVAPPDPIPFLGPLYDEYVRRKLSDRSAALQ